MLSTAFFCLHTNIFQSIRVGSENRFKKFEVLAQLLLLGISKYPISVNLGIGSDDTQISVLYSRQPLVLNTCCLSYYLSSGQDMNRKFLVHQTGHKSIVAKHGQGKRVACGLQFICLMCKKALIALF